MAIVQAVTFDLAGTLVVPHPSVGTIYARCAQRHGVDVLPAFLDAAFPLAFKGGPQRSKPEVFWREVVQRCFGPSLPAAKLETVFQECWHAFADEKNWRLQPGAVNAITAIKFLGIKVGVLSNADTRMRQVLEAKGLAKHLEGIFLSSEIALAKPDAKFFSHAARQLGVATSALVHIGNDPLLDGEAARDAGATGVIVGGAYAPERCLRAEKLIELPYLIRALVTEGKHKGKFSRTVLNLLANLSGLPEDRGRSTDRPLKTMDDAVAEAFKKLRLGRPVPEDAIIAHWHELLPLKLAKRCAPVRVLEGGKLVVQCENAVIKSEVRFHERSMLAKIRLLRGCQDVRLISLVNA